MRNSKSFSLIITLVSLIHGCRASLTTFTCPTMQSDPMPQLPMAYSTNVKLNYPEQLSTTEMMHFVNQKEKLEALEIWSPNRHVKYIHQKDQLLLIKYNDESGPTCTVKSSSTLELEKQDAGPSMILQKILQVGKEQFRVSTSSLETGVFMRKWEACFKNPSVNVSLGFTESDWKHPRKSALLKNIKVPILMEAQINNDHLVAIFSNFDPEVPDNVNFQPPENCYCEGYKSDKRPPSISNYFSYDSEMIVFESSEGISPLVSRRKVYYDFPSKIVRTDLYDPIAETPDIFSKVKAKGISIIHDFNSNTQYNIDPFSGKCTLDTFITTIDVSDVIETKSKPMLTGAQYFYLDTKQISYNGQFLTRGHLADVYTGKILRAKGNYIVSWYFSAVRTQIVENDKIERNVLLRMVIKPEDKVGYEGEVDINFYNFRKEEPTALEYDISSCYNNSVSKTFVITFPANEKLRGLEKFLKLPIHLALKDLTGLSMQRIFISEVNFNEKYMFTEFKLLDTPSAVKKTNLNDKEITLKQVIDKINEAISNDKFKVTVSLEKDLLELKPEPNGFNEFAGDRHLPGSGSATYKEGSVIALTVGMLFLGVVLGGVTINLIISRKYGVSLFQKSNGMNRFDNPLNESAM